MRVTTSLDGQYVNIRLSYEEAQNLHQEFEEGETGTSLQDRIMEDLADIVGGDEEEDEDEDEDTKDDEED